MQGQVANYLSIDSPQMGIGVLPKITCGFLCDWVNSIFSMLVYTDYLQTNLGASAYFRNPYKYEEYLEYSTFLADLNNERPDRFNQTYKDRFMKLEKAMFIKNANDTVLIPKESAWFEFFDNSGSQILKLQDSDFYKNDYIGLRNLVENQKVQFIEWQGDHVSFSFYDVDKYLLKFFK
jgi:palmitoyl-protein thioesterase